MSTEITVRGSFSAFQPPERATVDVSIGFEGPEMQSAYDRVARDLQAVRATVEQLKGKGNGPVTWWSAAHLRTWSTRPWNKDGEQLPLVHHASVDVQVKFRDFTEMSRWVGHHVADTEGFRLSGVRWALTAKRRDDLLKESRTRAVRDAVARAQQYADALGLGKVNPLAIADAGMLSAGLHLDGGHGGGYLRAASSASGGEDVELIPEDIEMSATVDARFVASTP